MVLCGDPLLLSARWAEATVPGHYGASRLRYVVRDAGEVSRLASAAPLALIMRTTTGGELALDFLHDSLGIGCSIVVDAAGERWAHDLCHRTTAGNNSRHVDRKVYKMRELQHAGVVKTVLVPTKDMRAEQTAR